jgi:hypothetical protein
MVERPGAEAMNDPTREEKFEDGIAFTRYTWGPYINDLVFQSVGPRVILKSGCRLIVDVPQKGNEFLIRRIMGNGRPKDVPEGWCGKRRKHDPHTFLSGESNLQVWCPGESRP